MKPKALVWLDKNFIIYGITNRLQQKLDFDKFAIVDGNFSQKNFFDNQDLVQFEKQWYFADNVEVNNVNPDLEYLSRFEKKFDINLWELVYSDRLFYPKYNKYFEFTKTQILSLLEQECKLFEKIIGEIKPDFLLINMIIYHHAFLLYKMCKKLEIPIFTIEPTHFDSKWEVREEVDQLIDMSIFHNLPLEKQKTQKQLLSFLKEYKPEIHGEKNKTKYKNSKINKISAAFKFFMNEKENTEKHYAYFGQSKSKVLTKGTATLHNIKKKKNESFLEESSISKIPSNNKFIYYPLTLEPERMMIMGAPYYTNQISVIENIAKSIPIDHLLYVKEHPAMIALGWRDSSFYKQIIDFTNVKLIHPSVSHDELIQNSSLVITLRGTAGLEAAFYGKPSICFSQYSGYSELSSVNVISNIEELPKILPKWMDVKVDFSELNKYVNYIENTTFDFYHVDFTSELSKKFNYQSGFLNDTNISSNMMSEFLDEYHNMFESAADMYYEKITKKIVHDNIPS